MILFKKLKARIIKSDSVSINDAYLTAATRGSLSSLKMAIMDGADVKARNERGMTALHLASEGNYLDCVAYLLEKGLNVDVKDRKKKTALHYACAKGHLSIVKRLIESNADVYHQCDGESALGVASKNARIDCVKYLLEDVVDFVSKRNEIHAAYAIAQKQYEYYLDDEYEEYNTRSMKELSQVMAVIEAHIKTVQENLVLNNAIQHQLLDEPQAVGF